jgi:hypothetical protein
MLGGDKTQEEMTEVAVHNKGLVNVLALAPPSLSSLLGYVMELYSAEKISCLHKQEAFY